MIQLKRIYDDPSDDDGFRVLVDRIWPRGVSKESARVDLWLKEVGPSDDLRKWFGHDPVKYAEFRKRYIAELSKNPAFDELKRIVADHSTVTLLFGAKDTEHNQAQVLLSHLK